jgi:3-methylcrotonyl-CoA carboxylase alpha subunit
LSLKKLLIANRGEIAVRVIRACRERDIESVAVYSQADEGAMHRRLAGESYYLGPAPAPESYLNVERLVEILAESGADAVHPGYGFLAESAAFARAVEEAGAIWVGPPPEAMEAVGFKVRAKELARAAGVPTVPGYDGAGGDEERFAEEAQRIGYPVLVKASAGGGGRGMRAVTRPEDFAAAVSGARREAEAAFGDGSVFLEKLIERPRHVEVQVIGDSEGNVIHLFERECSIQRRHQKIVEESPSPALNPGLREVMCAAAVRLAQGAGYRNAGTVEFLLEEENFYFLEMNARLQVEHPVTELVTGLDLVHLQLAVAAGEPLLLSQDDVTLRGSAVEVRFYAEDANGLPAGGRLLAFSTPEGPGVRNDVGFETGDEVSLHYDSMIAKLIVSSHDRPSAVRRLRGALRDCEVLGLPTNLPLLRRIADTPAFAAGETTIRFLDEHHLTELPPAPDVPPEALLLAAACEISRPPTTTDPFAAGPWRSLGAVRLRYRMGDRELAVKTERTSGRALLLSLDDKVTTVEVLSVENGRLSASLDGELVRANFALEDSDVLISFHGETYELQRPPPPDVDGAGPGDGAHAPGASLTAPMPGTVVQVMVGEGDEVEEGQPLLVVEAMKMEQTVVAPHAGRVSALPYAEGSLVPGGAVLAEIEEHA